MVRLVLETVNTVHVGIGTAFVEMRQHVLRSFLSIFGVTLGVAALVAMLSLIGGIEVFLKERIGIWAGAFWVWQTGEIPEDKKMEWSRSPGLRFSDGDYLKKNSTAVAKYYPYIERWDRAVVAGERMWRVNFFAVERETMKRDSVFYVHDKGEDLSQVDFETGRRVCLVSWGIIDRVKRRKRRQGDDFDGVIGQDVIYGNNRLKIIGTLAPTDPDTKSRRHSRMIVFPMKTMQKYFTGMNPDPGSLNLVVADAGQFEAQTLEAARALTQHHRGVEDFQYRGNEWAESMSEMLSNISLVMGIISVMSLMVGGMGILNVMLSSISERMKEIGIRKALGAKTMQIFMQFLTETLTLSFTGGILGCVLGAAPLFFTEAIKKSTQGAIEPTILPVFILYIALVIISVGIIFGLYPAIKAARMNPIEALRYE